MWPQGTNYSFLIGISDYFDDINRNQSSSLLDTDAVEIKNILKSLNNIISNNKSGGKKMTTFGLKTDEGEADESGSFGASIDDKIKKFFEWGETYMNNKNVNWQQLVELFNFSFPHYEIPSSVDVTLHHATYLYKACKEKGNEHMKNREPELAMECYTKAIELLEKVDTNENEANDEKAEETEEEESEEKDKLHKTEIAMIYSNRSASWVYLKEYQKAVDDAVRALELDPLLTKAWIRKGMAEQELLRYQVAYGDYQVARNQAKESDTYYKFLNKRIKQCFEQIIMQHTKNESGMNIIEDDAKTPSAKQNAITNSNTPFANINTPNTPFSNASTPYAPQ